MGAQHKAIAASTLPKNQRYTAASEAIAAVLAGEPNLTARMATAAAILASTFEEFLWTGFYIVDPARPDELVVGPYQGTLGCLRIPFGRGVCGRAAIEGRTIIVPDVEAFDGHIACDSRSRSEIVVPVHDPSGTLIAVLDVDSAAPAAFDAQDSAGLEAIAGLVFAA